MFFLILRKVTRGPVAYRSGVSFTQAVLFLCFYKVGEPLSRHCLFLIARASLCCQPSHLHHLRLSLLLLQKAATRLLVLCFSPLSEALFTEFFPTADPLEESMFVCMREASFVCAWPAAVQSIGDSAQGSSRLFAFFLVIFFFFVCLAIFPHQYFSFLTLIKFILNLYSRYLDPDSGF